MSVAEMKNAIIYKIASIESETILNEVLAILSQPEKKLEEINLVKNYDAIKEQYGEVLQKLAQ